MANRSRGRRTDYSWAVADFDVQTLDLAEGTKVLLGGISTILTTTLTRTRGEIFAELDATAVNERAVIAVGAVVVNEVAFATGIGALPGPATQGGDDWLWHGFLTVSSGQESAVALNSLYDRLTIDSKGMRKMKSDEVVAFLGEVASSSDQGGHATIMAGVRVLFGQ